MARYLQFAARACCVGAIIVIVAIPSRQVYLHNAAEADTVGANQEPATKMLIRCETMHNRLRNRTVPRTLRMLTSRDVLVAGSLEAGAPAFHHCPSTPGKLTAAGHGH
ncbi:hypothetical protein BJN34_09820 [Cupriavidus necator]|uniref:Uncharacterized protein n=1 Tax=Cupriavidus necator TaxID=106590 RepID=A0A1U9UPU0_CUPNE|nr:hypothetical protein BJN34_09820 [Cupriavidus necator]